MQSCKEKTTEIYLVLWLVRGVTTATKVHVLVGVEGGVAVRLAVQGLCETQYCAAVFIVNISIFFFQTSYPLPNTAVHLVYSMCEFFFPILFLLLAFSFFFSILPIFSSIFSVFYFSIFYLFVSHGVALHVSCRRLAPMRGASSLSQRCRLPSSRSLTVSLSLSPSHSLCVDCINLAHVVIAAIDA